MLGSAYSAPPLRLKRFPFLAAFSTLKYRRKMKSEQKSQTCFTRRFKKVLNSCVSAKWPAQGLFSFFSLASKDCKFPVCSNVFHQGIIVVRGIVVNMGFYAFIVDALGIAGLVQVSDIRHSLHRALRPCVESFQEKFQLAAAFWLRPSLQCLVWSLP